MPHHIRAFRPAAALLILALSASAAAATLPAYNVNLEQTSVSGISSGGYMAVQYAVAHSETVTGVGVFAGGPYRCAAGGVTQALGTCMQGEPDVGRAMDEADHAAAAGHIDPTENLARQRIWLFSGFNDGVVKRPVMDSLYGFFQHYAPSHQIYYQDTLSAGHAMITEHYGDDCPLTSGEFINDCDYDGAGLLLQHIYGGLTATPTNALSGEIIAFDQDAFVPDDSRLRGMAQEAYVYVPSACAAGEQCRVHLAFHGCSQSAETIGDTFYRQAGYNEWADANRIIVLYPQALATSFSPQNPQGCWDWWGYNGPNFAYRDGIQIAAVHAMLQRLAEGSKAAPSNQSSEPPRLIATDASDDSVALAWTSGHEGPGYHVYRATDPKGPFVRVTAEALSGKSYADTGLSPRTRYVYEVRPATNAGEGTASNRTSIDTRAPAPPCDPYFSNNVTHVVKGRATAIWGLTFAKGSWDFMGLWNLFSETALYRDGDGFQVGVCP